MMKSKRHNNQKKYKTMNYPTLEQIKKANAYLVLETIISHPIVRDVSDERKGKPGENDGIFIYLLDGFVCPKSGTSTIHEQTIGECCKCLRGAKYDFKTTVIFQEWERNGKVGPEPIDPSNGNYSTYNPFPKAVEPKTAKLASVESDIIKKSVDTKTMGEKNYCCVNAYAHVTGLNGLEALEIASKVGGRIRGDGMRAGEIERMLFNGRSVNAPNLKFSRVHRKCGLNIDFSRQVTVKEFVTENPTGRFFVYNRNHAYAIIDGVIHDFKKYKSFPKGKLRAAYKCEGNTFNPLIPTYAKI